MVGWHNGEDGSALWPFWNRGSAHSSRSCQPSCGGNSDRVPAKSTTVQQWHMCPGKLTYSNHWSGREDLNLRPPAPKAGALPGCATPRLKLHVDSKAFSNGPIS